MTKFIILAAIALIVVAVIYHYAGRVRAAGIPESHLAPLVDDTRGAILHARVNAALSGHDLGPFDEVDNGYQAACRLCGKTVWVGESGLMYSLLEDVCEGEGRTT